MLPETGLTSGHQLLSATLKSMELNPDHPSRAGVGVARSFPNTTAALLYTFRTLMRLELESIRHKLSQKNRLETIQHELK